MILINFKTYPEGTGRKALKLAKAIDKYKSAKLAISPQLIDLKEVSKAVRIPVYAQHVDHIHLG